MKSLLTRHQSNYSDLGLLIELLGPVRAGAARVSAEVGSLFNQLAYWTLLLWSVYPIIWGLGEGSGTINLVTEVAMWVICADIAPIATF